MLTEYGLVGDVLVSVSVCVCVCVCVVQNLTDLKFFTQTSELQSSLWHVMEYLCDCVQHL